jgi:hypothetical protein
MKCPLPVPAKLCRKQEPRGTGFQPVCLFLPARAGLCSKRKGLHPITAVLALVAGLGLTGRTSSLAFESTAAPATAPSANAATNQEVSHPYLGVTLISRKETSPRPNRMHVVDIDLSAPGIRFRLTPQAGRLDTIKQTTLDFLKEQQAQMAINAHFFEPWPPPAGDDGAVSLMGVAVSDGHVYSPFKSNPSKPYAIAPNAAGLNIDPDNHASIVHRHPADPTGCSVIGPVKLWTTVSGSAQIISNGVVTVPDTAYFNALKPRTAIGIAPSNHLILFIVDGRQRGVSEGLKVGEAANLLRKDYGVTDALQLDDGGSTTLVMDTPTPHAVNVPVGINDVPKSLRPVGTSLAVFARPYATDSAARNTSAELGLVPEMEAFPELAWPRRQTGELPPELRPALALWQEQSRLLATNVTPEAVRSLSRWAKPQMTNYTRVPPLASVKFAVIGEDKPGGRLLLEGTLDTLPTHSKLVTRWLKVYLVCDTKQRTILRTVITIRGERQE